MAVEHSHANPYREPEPEPEPSPRKRKAAASSSSSGADREQGLIAGEKVCIICTTSLDQWIDDDYLDRYHIYIVDLDGDDIDHRGFNSMPAFKHPTLRLGPDCLDAETFCVLNSTLYIFESFDMMTNPCKGKSVFTCKLPPSNVSNLRLERHMLQKIPDMHDFKFFPVAIPTPDGKRILVFSSRFDHYQPPADFADFLGDFEDESCGDLVGVFEDEPLGGDFEIYDPDGGGSWHKLPGIPIDWRVVDFHVVEYTFIDEDVLLLHSNTGMRFTLDLGSPDRPWQMVYSPLPISGWGYFIFLGCGLHLTPVFAYDIEQSFDFPKLSSLGHKNTQRRRCITLLDVNNRGCKFCVIQTEINRETLRPHLIVNVYLLDQQEYEKGKGKKLEDQGKRGIEKPPLPGTSTCKSFKFRFNVQAVDDIFQPLFLFSIPADRRAPTLY